MSFQVHPIPLNFPHAPIPQVSMSSDGVDRYSLQLNAVVILKH